MFRHRVWLAALLTAVCVSGSSVGEADVVKVEVAKEGSGSYRFDVSVRHADEGWNHYANKWEVVAADGTILATRTLLHPHENEQPFTRSLSGVKIPAEIKKVTIRATDSKHGAGGAEIEVELPQ